MVTRFSMHKCVGIKLMWTCWLKMFFGPNVLGCSHHVFLEGDTQPQERLIIQSLGENTPLAQGRVSTLVSEHCVLCTTSPPEGRRHLLRFWQGCYSVSSSAFMSCPRVLVWCCTFLSTPSFHSSWHHSFNPFFVALTPLPHPVLFTSIFTVLVVFYSFCQLAIIDNWIWLCYVLSFVCGIFIYNLSNMWNSLW
jgi:hypothetical protein